MPTTLTFISTAIALCLTVASFIIGYFEGRETKDTTFQFQRKPMLTAYLCLSLYFAFTLYRNINGNMEIMHSMSLISLYFVYEVFFLSSTAFNQTYYYNNKNYWIFFNTPPIIALIIHYVLVLTDHSHKYYSFHDFVDAFNGPDKIGLYFKIFFVVLLGIYKFMMVYLILISWRKRRKQLTKDPSYRYRSTRLGRMFLLWFFMLTIFYVGQFVNAVYYHVIAKLLLSGLVVYCTIGFHRYYLTTHQSKHHTEFSHVHKKLEEWLKINPFPLANQGISTDQIADALQISREEISFYIYTVCGLTFNGWLSSRRLERCVQLLEESELNMSEIAYTTGYSHLAAMSKAFKTKYGCSPREYRKKLLADQKFKRAGDLGEEQ